MSTNNVEHMRDTVCPTCGKLLDTAHLNQLNLTLATVLNAKNIPLDSRERSAAKIIEQIILVSKSIAERTIILPIPPSISPESGE